jgi:hypothetical protein
MKRGDVDWDALERLRDAWCAEKPRPKALTFDLRDLYPNASQAELKAMVRAFNEAERLKLN